VMHAGFFFFGEAEIYVRLRYGKNWKIQR
jgi:hypothetical protein